MSRPHPASPFPAPVDMDAYDRETQQLAKNGQRIAVVSSILAIVLRIFTLLMQSVDSYFSANNRIGVIATAAICLQQYYKNQQVWMDGTIIWPTILNLLAAIIIVTWNGIVLCGYFFGKAVAERWATHDGLANVIQNTLCAFATAIMLGTASSPTSLENQACSNSAPTAVNSGAICFFQVQYLAYEMVMVELYPASYACPDLVGNVDVRLGSHCQQTSENRGKAQFAKTQLGFCDSC